ncbi:MAG: pyridoxal-phosphate dependent enzyme [Candidatus Dormibacteraceae bacterium]
MYPAVHKLSSWDIYAKLELFNPFGSVKDRTALAMIGPDTRQISAESRTIVEFSSGNTAKALAVLAGMSGIPFRTVTNRMKVPELKEQLLVLGAEIDELPGQAACLDPTDPDDPMAQTWQNLEREGRAIFHTNQYFNLRNSQIHETTTGQEILADLGGQAPDVFIATVGTAGSSSGVARTLRRIQPNIEVVGVVSASNDFIPGIRTAQELATVGLFDQDNYTTLLNVSSQAAIDGTMTLVWRAGLLCGPTTGAAFHGTLEYLSASQVPPGERRTAVFIACDRLEPYLGYIRKRRPELFGDIRRKYRVSAVSPEQCAATPELTVEEARQWIAKVQPLIVDLRGPHAFRVLHIPGSINIVGDVFDDLCASGSPIDRNRPTLIVCPIGEDSRRFAALLTQLGHPSARSLAGGVIAWRDAGAPLASTPSPPVSEPSPAKVGA